MLENKNLLLGIIFFFGGVLGSGLFAIAQAACDVAYTLGNSAQNVCGILCFLFLVLLVVGLVFIIKEVVTKKH